MPKQQKLDYCYHTHTSRCGHASGRDEDYVLLAASYGYKELGFSDHIMFPDFSQPGIRGDYTELRDYEDSVFYLREKYKSVINIYLGFECEYMEKYDEYYRYLLTSGGFDYLILGNHGFIQGKDWVWYNSLRHSEIFLQMYCESSIKALSTGYFSIFAHPDHFINGYQAWDELAIYWTRKIIEASIKYDVPLEVNAQGTYLGLDRKTKERKTYSYPYLNFWKEVGKSKAKCVIGVDAHDPGAFDREGVTICKEIAKECNLNLVKRVKFKKVS